MTDIQSAIRPAASRGDRKPTKANHSPRAARKAARATVSAPPAAILEPVVRTPAAGKLGEMVALMRRRGGASLADLMTVTGWQAHSVRGALAGSLKRARGYTIGSDKVDGVRVYTIAADDAQT
jgi:hypothetical protein